MEALEKAGKTAANLRCDFPPLPVIRFQTPDTKTSRVSPTYGFSHVGLGHLGIGGFSMCFHPPDPILPLLFRVTTLKSDHYDKAKYTQSATIKEETSWPKVKWRSCASA